MGKTTAVLGKTVVVGRDTPGFIANRIGCYWIAVGIIEAIRHGLSIEQADAIAGPPFGVPRTGVFGLLDLIGLDLVPTVWGGLLAALPAGDDLHAYDLTAEPLIRRLIAEKRFGRKSGAGFYRQDRVTKHREALDLVTGDYRIATMVDPTSLPGGGADLAALIASDTPASRYARRVMERLQTYVSSVGPSIAESMADVDTAMELGYAWAKGPVKLAAAIGLN